jgi:hypothetical protein
MSDLNLVVKTDANRDRHMNEKLDDPNLSAVDANRGHHRNVKDDQNDLKTDVSHDRRKSDLHLDVMDDQKMVVTTDVSHDLRKNDLHLDVTDDQKMDVSHDLRKNDLHLVVKILDVKMNCHRVIRKCALNDLSLDAMKTGDPNMNCDQLSRDHLLCDHRKLRHRGKNLNLDGKNLDVKMMNHHGCHPKMDDRMRLHRENHLMMADLMKI